jgi:hypothetical protein
MLQAAMVKAKHLPASMHIIKMALPELAPRQQKTAQIQNG